MAPALIERTDVLCTYCGRTSSPEEMLLCSECGGGVCPQCATDGPQPLCPVCVSSALPRNIQPMLAVLSDMPPHEELWGLEYAWDGIRTLSYWDGRRLTLQNRRLTDITAYYPELQQLANMFRDRPLILDGEIVALTDQGHPDEAALQRRMRLNQVNTERAAAEIPVFYFIFDLLFMGDRSLMDLPYAERRDILTNLDIERGCCRVPPSHIGQGQVMLETARDIGLEGIIAKQLDSTYEPGCRSPHWRQVKVVNSQEFVIGGWIPQAGARKRVGALLLGYYDAQRRLQVAGRVDTGMTDEDREALVCEMRPFQRQSSPFATSTEVAWRDEQAIYLTPQLVAKVQYRAWPAGGLLQQASYKGLRPDRVPSEVTREEKVGF